MLNLIAAVVNTAGVLLLTASLLQYFIPGNLSLTVLCLLLHSLCLTILLAGHYRVLDGLSRLLMLSLTICTFAALFIAWRNGPMAPAHFVSPSPWQLSALAFIVATMGWMPVPIELSAINSMWLRSKQKLTQVSLTDGLFDFNLGYFVAVILAVAFVALSPMLTFAMTLAFLTTPLFCMVKLQPGSRQWHFKFHELAGMGWHGLPDRVQPALPDLVPVLALIMRQTPA